LYIAVLGALKAKCVVSPLFSAFGPEPIATRLGIGDGQVLVTTEALYRRKVEAVRDRLPRLAHVILVDDGAPVAGTLRWGQLMAVASDQFVIPPTAPDDMALLHFTSGTTGRPKGAIHVHEAVVTHYVTGLYALDLHDDDIFWCTADPGWVTGTSYGIIAPLTHGVTSLVVEAEFDAQSWYRILAEERVTVWYTAPTAIRMMMKLGAEAVRGYDFGAVRFMASVGEPLNPEAVIWGVEAFGRPFHDNWWQTEIGGIMIANFLGLPVKPGSMGLPLPGIEAAIVQRVADGSVTVTDEPMIEGELALKAGWPSMMRGYLHEDERYRKCFAGAWVPDRRSGEARRRRVFLVRRPRRRCDQILRPSDRAVRGRKRADGALGGGGGRRNRQARSDGGRDRQGLCGAEARLCGVGGAAPRAPRACAPAARRRGGAEGNRLPRQLAQDAQRQDHAPAVEGTRAWSARRRSVEPGERRAMSDERQSPP
jgi:acyl-coenzyme A synthetase/AMP-(fatty) acid ligase